MSMSIPPQTTISNFPVSHLFSIPASWTALLHPLNHAVSDPTYREPHHCSAKECNHSCTIGRTKGAKASEGSCRNQFKISQTWYQKESWKIWKERTIDHNYKNRMPKWWYSFRGEHNQWIQEIIFPIPPVHSGNMKSECQRNTSKNRNPPLSLQQPMFQLLHIFSKLKNHDDDRSEQARAI